VRITSSRATWLVFIGVAVLAFVRMLPVRLEYEEPQLLAEAGAQDPLTYLFTQWNGALTLFGRASFLVAAQFGDAGAFVTRLIAAAVIGAVGAYLFGRSAAIPDMRVRLIVAFSLPLFPIPDPGPYIGPLNSQWWFAIAFAGMALSGPKRWHYPALVIGGLAGIGPCLLWPAFRDRRLVFLLVPAIIQAVVLFESDRRPKAAHLDLAWVVLVLALCAALILARLPLRTRLVFLYAGMSILAIGFLTQGSLVGQGRYLAIPAAGFVLGAASFLPPLRRAGVSREPDRSD
jgi:hypothetical protein